MLNFVQPGSAFEAACSSVSSTDLPAWMHMLIQSLPGILKIEGSNSLGTLSITPHEHCDIALDNLPSQALSTTSRYSVAVISHAIMQHAFV